MTKKREEAPAVPRCIIPGRKCDNLSAPSCNGCPATLPEVRAPESSYDYVIDTSTGAVFIKNPPTATQREQSYRPEDGRGKNS